VDRDSERRREENSLWQLLLSHAAIDASCVNTAGTDRQWNRIMASPILVLVSSLLAGMEPASLAVDSCQATARTTNSTPAVAEVPLPVAAILDPFRKRHDLPAMGAAIATSQGVRWSGVSGVRKRGTDVPVTVGDHWHLGSDTKAMTAWLAARMAEEGKISWATTLETHFPELAKTMRPELATVTLEELFSHQAGFADQFNLHQLGGNDRILAAGKVRQQRSEAARQLLVLPVDHPPRSRFAYTNVGYILAGAVLEKAGDAEWETLMWEKVFGPLKMKSVGFGGTGTAGKVDQPWPHAGDGRPLPNGPATDNPPVLGPAGTVHASLDAWGCFVADVLRGFREEKGVLSKASYDRLRSTPFGGNYTAGGWSRGELRGQSVYMHDGSNTLNYCTAILIPHADLAILVCTNQGGDAARQACHAARRELGERALAEPR
jgi:CubicO group peptidase (beta-lactamase class C family)